MMHNLENPNRRLPTDPAMQTAAKGKKKKQRAADCWTNHPEYEEVNERMMNWAANNGKPATSNQDGMAGPSNSN